MRRLERERGPALAVNLHIPPLIPALFFSRQRRIVLTAHTTYLGMSGRFDQPRHFDSPWSRLSVAIKMAMERHILDRAAQVITLTEQGRQELARYGRHGGVAVIPNGVDTATFIEDPKVAQDIDVLFCGRIERRKGSRPLAEVCLRLLQARPTLRICIVGYGDDEAHVRQRLAAVAGPDGPVHFAGRVPLAAMPDLYRRSRVYASTSYYEGLPGTCLEAMATGVPAVVWNLPFYAGLVVEGCSGLLAPVNDLEHFTQRVLELIDQPDRAAALGRQAAHLVRRRHDDQWALGECSMAPVGSAVVGERMARRDPAAAFIAISAGSAGALAMGLRLSGSKHQYTYPVSTVTFGAQLAPPRFKSMGGRSGQGVINGSAGTDTAFAFT